MSGSPSKLGAMLVDAGLLEPAQLEAALARQQQSGLRLGRILIEAQALSEEQLLSVLSGQLGLDICDPTHLPVALQALERVDPREAFQHRILPLREEEGTPPRLVMVSSDPVSMGCLHVEDRLEKEGFKVHWLLASEPTLEKSIARHYGARLAKGPIDSVVEQNNEATEPGESPVPVIQGTPVAHASRGTGYTQLMNDLSLPEGEDEETDTGTAPLARVALKRVAPLPEDEEEDSNKLNLTMIEVVEPARPTSGPQSDLVPLLTPTPLLLDDPTSDVSPLIPELLQWASGQPHLTPQVEPLLKLLILCLTDAGILSDERVRKILDRHPSLNDIFQVSEDG